MKQGPFSMWPFWRSRVKCLMDESTISSTPFRKEEKHNYIADNIHISLSKTN